jgi:uncharacterized membrane protein
LALIYFTSGVAGLLGSHRHDPVVRYPSFHALFTALGFLALHAVLGMLCGTFLLLQALTDVASGIFGLLQTYRAYQGNSIAIPVLSAIARKHAEPDDMGNNSYVFIPDPAVLRFRPPNRPEPEPAQDLTPPQRKEMARI